MMLVVRNSYIIIILFLTSCDFTPRLHKDILIAQKYTKSHHYQKAIVQYENICKKNPSSLIKVKVYYQLGELYSIQMAKYEKALNYYSLIKKESKDPLWLVKAEEKMGEINFNYVRKYDASIINYKKLIGFVPRLKNYDFYYFRLGMALFKNQQLTEALGVFREIQVDKKSTFSAKAYYYAGMLYYQKKEWIKAVRYWKKYISKENRRDNIIQAKFLIANAYETMEELKKAYNLYYSILGEYPNTSVVQNRLNSVYARRIARKR